MKKPVLFFILLLSLAGVTVAQDAISYQAIARDNAGAILSNQSISVKFEIRQGSITGTSVFSETHTTVTNQFGLFTLAIGSVGTTQFQAINWANMPYFMEISIDPAGGTSYTSVGNQQLMSVPYALYAKAAGNAGITPTISINSPNTVTSSAGSYSINVPASTTYSAGTGIAISGGVISNTATTSTPTITGTGGTTVNGSGNTFTVNSQAYTAGSGINISSGVISNTSTLGTPTITGAGGTTVNASGNTFTVSSQAYTAGSGINISSGVISNTSTLGTPTITGTGVTSVSSAGNTFTVNTPAPALSYTALGNQLSVSQGTAVSTVTLVAGNVYGLGTIGNVPMWGSITSLTTSPITTFTNTGGVVINPTLVGNGSPAQSLQVHGPSSGTTYVAHFLQGSTANTGIAISTQPINGHAIGTLNNQDLGFFTNNTNVTGSYPLVLKTSGRVGIGTTSPSYSLDVSGGINTSVFYNMNGMVTPPPTSNGGDGKLYFNSSLNKLMMSENGGAWVPVANTLWTRGSGILYNTTLSDNVGIGTNTPSNKLDVLATAPGSALRVTNNGIGNGIEATINSSGSAAVLAYNDGPGVSIYGSKSLSASSGNAGRFEIFNSANTSNALVAVTPGSGAAVHAMNTSSNGLASNLSVLMEDGHLKARFTNAVTTADVFGGTTTLGPVTYATGSNADQSNDVRGAITMNGSFSMSQGETKSVTTTVGFKKTYRNAPIIILTPYVPNYFPENLIVTTQVFNTGGTDFTFRVTLNYVGTGSTVNFNTLTINYFILE